MDISVEKAKQIREDIGATHLVLFAHGPDGDQNVSTHGGTEEEAHQAADFGNTFKRLMGWPESLCQSTPAQRAEWKRKTATAIQADIDRLLAQKQRNQADQQALLEKTPTSPARRDESEREWARLQRLNEDYMVRVHALEWVLAV